MSAGGHGKDFDAAPELNLQIMVITLITMCCDLHNFYRSDRLSAKLIMSSRDNETNESGALDMKP